MTLAETQKMGSIKQLLRQQTQRACNTLNRALEKLCQGSTENYSWRIKLGAVEFLLDSLHGVSILVKE